MTARFSYAIYSRPLARPFRYGNSSLQERRGLILRRELDGIFHFAEAAPLPGHSRETLHEVESALASLHAPQHAGRLPPSLRFALDSFGLENQNADHFHPVHSNALITWEDLPAAQAQVEARRREGFSVFKLKLMKDNLSSVLELVGANPGTIFRLDGNRSLGESELGHFFSLLTASGLAHQIDYLEEPAALSWDHPLLTSAPVAIAADESAGSMEDIFRLVDSQMAPAVFVLKASVLGSLSSLAEIAEELRTLGKRAIFTSTLEAEPGRRALLRFLGEYGGIETHGLATGHVFRESFLPDQATFTSVPNISAGEASWLRGLEWKDCR